MAISSEPIANSLLKDGLKWLPTQGESVLPQQAQKHDAPGEMACVALCCPHENSQGWNPVNKY